MESWGIQAQTIIIILFTSCLSYYLQENNHFSKIDGNFCIILDNASIHKTKKVISFATDNGVRLVTIPAYSPALNPAEKLIQAIKEKLKRKYEAKMIMSLSMMKQVVDEIAESQLEKYIYSSRKECAQEIQNWTHLYNHNSS